MSLSGHSGEYEIPAEAYNTTFLFCFKVSEGMLHTPNARFGVYQDHEIGFSLIFLLKLRPE